MPELPEVEIARRDAQRWLQGRTLSAVSLHDATLVRAAPPLVDTDRLDFGVLAGDRLVAARRRAKLLVLELGQGTLLVHFRMTGKLVQTPATQPRLSFVLDDDSVIGLVDRRRLAWAALVRHEAAERYIGAQGYGPEPYPGPLSASVLGARLRATNARRLKDVLLDQRVVAGLGNIAVCEALWRARLHPQRAPASLDADALTALASAIDDHIGETLRNEEGRPIRYVSEAGAPNPFRVYKRDGEPCPRCGTTLSRVKISGRSTFLCGTCQTP